LNTILSFLSPPPPPPPPSCQCLPWMNNRNTHSISLFDWHGTHSGSRSTHETALTREILCTVECWPECGKTCTTLGARISRACFDICFKKFLIEDAGRLMYRSHHRSSATSMNIFQTMKNPVSLTLIFC
jgi:hypothetical protein